MTAVLDRPQTRSIRDFRTAIVVAASTALSLVLGFWHLGAQSFWQDEGVTAALVTRDWSGFWEQVTSFEGNMAGYYLLLWMWPWHDSEVDIRSLSVVLMAAAVPLVFWIGRELRGWVAGAWSAVFFACWPFIVHYAQEARSYALLTLLVTAATAALLKASRTAAPGWWAAYGALLGLGFYAHLYVLLIVPVHLLWVVLHRPSIRNAMLATVSGLVVASPMLYYFAAHRGSTQISWIPEPTASFLVSDIAKPITGYSRPLGALVLAAVALVVLARKVGIDRVALLLAWALVPAALALVYSVVASPIMQAHYLIGNVPALTLILGVAVSLIPWRWPMVVVGALVVVAALRAVSAYYDGFRKPQIREAAAYVSAQTQPRDAVVEDVGLQPALTYYWRDVPHPTDSPTDAAAERLWLLTPNQAPATTPAGWAQVSQQAYYHVTVVLYDRP